MNPRTLTVVRPGAETPAAAAARMQDAARAASDSAYADFLAALERAAEACIELQVLRTIPAGVRREAEFLARDINTRIRNMVQTKARA